MASRALHLTVVVVAHAALVVSTSVLGACDDACCVSDDDCAQGLLCFEARCARTCDADAGCDEGQICDADGDVCTGASGADNGCVEDDSAAAR